MKIYLSIFLFYFSSTLLSQTTTCDKIVCINGEEIEVIVSEITSEFISYKKCDNIDGPKYSIEKSKVFIIKYKNGSKEIINNLNEPVVSTFKKNKPIISNFKKKKEIHGKLYRGLELHYDEALNYKNDAQFSQNESSIDPRSSSVCGSFLFNFKANKVCEIDFSIGLGLSKLIYYKQINYDQGSYLITYLKNRETIIGGKSNNDYRGMAILNIGSRINYLNFFALQEGRNNPFIKPEISIMKKAGHSWLVSYSAILGVNFNKRFSCSIGYKYTPLKTTTAKYDQYSWNSQQSNQIIDNSVIGFHNLVGKVSYEF
jgi:hypothetical protein